MSARMRIAILSYEVVQAVVFGVGAALALAAPPSHAAMTLLPLVIATSLLIAAPAPLARAQYARKSSSRRPTRSFEN